MTKQTSPFFKEVKERPPPDERRKAKRDAHIADLDRRVKEARGPKKVLLQKVLDRRRKHVEQMTEQDRKKKLRREGKRKVRAAKVAERLAARSGGETAPSTPTRPTAPTSFADMSAADAIVAVKTMDAEALENARIIEEGRDRGPRSTVIEAMDDRNLENDGGA